MYIDTIMSPVMNTIERDQCNNLKKPIKVSVMTSYNFFYFEREGQHSQRQNETSYNF